MIMLRIVTVLLVLTAPQTWGEALSVPDRTAVQVAANTWVIHGPMDYPNPENRGFINNPGLVVTPAGVVIVDPGSSVQIGDMLLRQMRAITAKPVIAILNTHVHGDHWLGNDAVLRAFPGVPIYGHPKMIAAIDEGAGEQWIDSMNRLTDNAVAGTQVVKPTHAIGDGTVLDLGGFEFRVHHTGTAHTNNDLMIEVVSEDVLFTGDNATNGRILRMDDGNFEGNAQALELALSLDRKVVVPGHGETAGPELIEAYRAYLESLYDAVAELYEEGISDFEMKEAVHARLEPYHQWAGYETELGRHISLAYLQVEAAEF
jgi:glyoxylase-like metal-dependent hydrolase (beta-lactamase superfamily II)